MSNLMCTLTSKLQQFPLSILKMDIPIIKQEQAQEDQLYFSEHLANNVDLQLVKDEEPLLTQKASANDCIKLELSPSDLKLAKDEFDSLAALHGCFHCDYNSKQENLPVSHMKLHDEKACFNCSFCDYKACNVRYVKMHAKIHRGEKPFQCPLCNYGSSRKDYLNIHIETHKNERLYDCFHCDYKTAQKHHLVRHMKKHREERDFKCLCCNYSACGAKCLELHMKIHSNERHISI